MTVKSDDDGWLQWLKRQMCCDHALLEDAGTVLCFATVALLWELHNSCERVGFAHGETYALDLLGELLEDHVPTSGYPMARALILFSHPDCTDLEEQRLWHRVMAGGLAAGGNPQ